MAKEKGFYNKYIKGRKISVRLTIKDYKILRFIARKRGLAMTKAISEILLTEYQKLKK